MYRLAMVLVLTGFCLTMAPVESGKFETAVGNPAVAFKSIQHWRQTTLLPEWRDTYEVLLEQEMLA